MTRKYMTCINLSVLGIDIDTSVVYKITEDKEIHIECLYVADIDLEMTDILNINGALDKVLDLVCVAPILAEYMSHE